MVKRTQRESIVKGPFSRGKAGVASGQLKPDNGVSAQHSCNGCNEEEGLLSKTGPFNMILHDVTDIVLIKNSKGYYTSVNIITASASRRDMSEIIGKNDFDLFPVNIANHIVRDIDRKVIKGG